VGISRIRPFKPQRGAVRLLARQAFNYPITYGPAWEDFKQRTPLHGKVCQQCLRRPARARHHIIPASKGGRHSLNNVALLCDKCHAKQHPHRQRRRIRRINAKHKY
jgi:5-methylcytosine-specific restriction endonuclease McrA